MEHLHYLKPLKAPLTAAAASPTRGKATLSIDGETVLSEAQASYRPD